MIAWAVLRVVATIAVLPITAMYRWVNSNGTSGRPVMSRHRDTSYWAMPADLGRAMLGTERSVSALA
jgi:hypothetical protein